MGRKRNSRCQRFGGDPMSVVETIAAVTIAALVLEAGTGVLSNIIRAIRGEKNDEG